MLLSAREFGREFVRLFFDLHQAKQFAGTVAPLGEGGRAAEIHRQHHVLERGQGRKQLEKLKDHADGMPAPDGELVFTKPFHLLSADHDLALGGTVQACDHIDQCRLAAARFADDRYVLALIDVQVNTLQGEEQTRVGLVGFFDAVQVNEMRCVVIGHVSPFANAL